MNNKKTKRKAIQILDKYQTTSKVNYPIPQSSHRVATDTPNNVRISGRMKIHRWGAQDVSPSMCSQNKASNKGCKWMGVHVWSGAYLCCVQLPSSLIHNSLQVCFLIPIKHLRDTPRLQQTVAKKTPMRVPASRRVQQRHWSLCEGWGRVRLASPSPSQWHNTTVTFVWAFYSKGHFCQSELLLACHYYDSLGFTIFLQFTDLNGALMLVAFP